MRSSERKPISMPAVITFIVFVSLYDSVMTLEGVKAMVLICTGVFLVTSAVNLLWRKRGDSHDWMRHAKGLHHQPLSRRR